jgi:hypothetical protein
MNSSIPPENMNVANTIAKKEKPIRREGIFVICNH